MQKNNLLSCIDQFIHVKIFTLSEGVRPRILKPFQ